MSRIGQQSKNRNDYPSNWIVPTGLAVDYRCTSLSILLTCSVTFLAKQACDASEVEFVAIVPVGSSRFHGKHSLERLLS